MSRSTVYDDDAYDRMINGPEEECLDCGDVIRKYSKIEGLCDVCAKEITMGTVVPR